MRTIERLSVSPDLESFIPLDLKCCFLSLKVRAGAVDQVEVYWIFEKHPGRGGCIGINYVEIA